MNAANRPRLHAHLLATDRPPNVVKLAVVADQRALERENLRLRATLMTIANAPEVTEADQKVNAYSEWRGFARKALERVTR